jgi:hypothetical protein
VSGPSPALVTQSGARRLPRTALLLLCAAYLLPGLFGRDPWRSAEITAFGQMLAVAEGRTSWWTPALGGVATDAALLPTWLGALFIKLGAGGVDAALAARLPFAALLALTFALVWYTTFHLARTEAAQPVAFAFGGEADPVAYARAMADGALLALIASLGLLQLGHETTPELAQLCAMALFLYGLAAAPFRVWRARGAVLLALPLLAGSGAPSMALAAAAGGVLVCSRSSYAQVRAFALWVGLAGAGAALLATGWSAWRWRVDGFTPELVPQTARQWLWFLWPVWPLALWTLWRWRRHLMNRHLSVPMTSICVALAANLVMRGSDRALLLALPGLAVLAAFALPTLKRQATAAIDWFSMFFFTSCALALWVIYVAMQTGTPAKTAAKVERLAPGFDAPLSWLAVGLGLAATLAWLWLLRWRTGRHREALWKSLVLPAGGVALSWLLLMTLWLPSFDYVRSSRAWVERVQAFVPPRACVAAPGMAPAAVAALEYHGRWRVDASPDALHASTGCDYALRTRRTEPTLAPPEGWLPLSEVRRPSDRREVTQILRRTTAG